MITEIQLLEVFKFNAMTIWQLQFPESIRPKAGHKLSANDKPIAIITGYVYHARSIDTSMNKLYEDMKKGIYHCAVEPIDEVLFSKPPEYLDLIEK